MKNPPPLLLIAFILFLNTSCKKKKEVEPEVSPIVSTPEPAIPSKIDGKIDFENSFQRIGDSIVPGGMIFTASFFLQAHSLDSIDIINPNTDVGGVTLNGKQLQKKDFGNTIYYTYSAGPSSVADLKQRSWNISGNGSYQQMNFSENTPIPNYVYTTSLADTIFKTSENIIKLGKISNVDSAEITVSSPNGIFTKKIALSDTQVKISPEDFLYFKNSTDLYDYVYVELLLSKLSYQTVSGKSIRFNSVARYGGGAVLKLK